MLVTEDSGGNSKAEPVSVTEATATQTLSRGPRLSPGHGAPRARGRQPVGKRRPRLQARGPAPGSACGHRLPQPEELDTDASCPEARKPGPARDCDPSTRKTHGFAVTSVERSGAKGRLTCTRARLLLTTLYCSRGSSICPVLAWTGRGADLSPLGVAEGVPPPWRPRQVSGGPLTAARADGPASCQRATWAEGWGRGPLETRSLSPRPGPSVLLRRCTQAPLLL